MRVIYERCCGLDVYKKTVVACVLITSPDGQVHKQVRTFATTASLLALADWLASLQVSHVAMESSGIYWRPVFNLLEEGHTIILVNAQHMKAVPQPLSSATAIRILYKIPGVNERIGTIVVAELGTQMDRFPDEAHLSSWVGLCPAAKISASKRLSTKTGNRESLAAPSHRDTYEDPLDCLLTQCPSQRSTSFI
jgi:transposase